MTVRDQMEALIRLLDDAAKADATEDGWWVEAVNVKVSFASPEDAKAFVRRAWEKTEIVRTIRDGGSAEVIIHGGEWTESPTIMAVNTAE